MSLVLGIRVGKNEGGLRTNTGQAMSTTEGGVTLEGACWEKAGVSQAGSLQKPQAPAERTNP